MIENNDSTKETPAESEAPSPFVPQRLTDAEAHERIKEILLNAASKSSTEVDEASIDAATTSIFDAMKKSFV
jgi:hypothetical protein